MSKVTLEFNLPEEQAEFYSSVNGSKFQIILEDLDGYLRSQIKYNDQLTEISKNIYEDIREKLYEYLEDRGVKLNDY